MINPYSAIDIAKAIGQPIDAALPVPVGMAAICELETADYGDDVYYFSAYDTNTDIIYTAGDNGEVTSNRKSPSGATALPLVGIQSDLAYVTLEEMQHVTSSVTNKDLTALGRKKAAITRSMDKQNMKELCDLILGLSGQEVTSVTADDLYTMIIKLVQKVEDYADNYILLCGSTIYNAIQTFEHDNVTTFEYRLGIQELLTNLHIKVIKMVGSVALDTTSANAAVLAATKCILVGINSSLVGGKPCLFVRRKINPEIAKQLGFPIDSAERLLTTIGGLSIINNSKNILGYGVIGYESRAIAVTNPYAIAWSDDMAL